MENRKIQFRSKACNLHLSAYPGHFATKHSHVNYFLDMTTLKVRQSNAEEAARALVPLYKHNTVVDTIVCLDGSNRCIFSRKAYRERILLLQPA